MARLALLALVLACAATSARALYFYLAEGATRCFIEELPPETVVVGKCASVAEAACSKELHTVFGKQRCLNAMLFGRAHAMASVESPNIDRVVIALLPQLCGNSRRVMASAAYHVTSTRLYVSHLLCRQEPGLRSVGDARLHRLGENATHRVPICAREP